MTELAPAPPQQESVAAPIQEGLSSEFTDLQTFAPQIPEQAVAFEATTTIPEASTATQELSIEDRRDAESVSRLLNSPGNFLMEGDEIISTGDGMRELRKRLDERGFDSVVNGMKVLRRMAGEEEYQGVEVVHDTEPKRTDLDEFLPIVADGKLRINDWVRNPGAEVAHDVRFHLMGALLSSGDINAFSQASAERAMAIEDKDMRGQIGNALDDVTNYITEIWRAPNHTELNAGELTRALTQLQELAFPDATEPLDVEKLVAEQLQLIRTLQDLELPDAQQPQPSAA